ncbi:MAG: elongation factor G [Proteobacteria bacterium]|nr:elongation factor G [Pseudomonadota bacterium]
MSDTRTVAIVGASLSGKTTLLESLLFAAGAIGRKGAVKDGNTVGDSAPEARERQMSTEVSSATAEHKGVALAFLDCPGSVEFAAEARNALVGADAALVVCEPVMDRAPMLAPVFRFLADNDIPHFLFINKMDRASGLVRDLIPALQAVSDKPLVLHQVPIRDGDAITGYVDLVSEKAYAYQDSAPSKVVDLPEAVKDREESARTQLLESLADFDDTLLEMLLEDEVPSTSAVLDYLKREVAANQVVPVFLGVAEQEHGVRRLLDHLAELVPTADATAQRRGIDSAGSEPLAQVLKTYLTPHGGKLSLARVWRGVIPDGTVLNGERVAGIYRLQGSHQTKLDRAEAGDVVALGRLNGIKTGDTLVQGNANPAEELPRVEPLPAVYALAVTAEERGDEVKMSTAIAKVIEEDPLLSVEQNPDTQEFVLWGQGEIHLQVALARLRNKYNIRLTTRQPRVAYKEAIRKSVSQHGRFKRQTGGHGMYGDVHLDIKPRPRGSGFEFQQKVVGGVVPRQYIPAVETGVKEFLRKGPLGFPVVDLSVTLTDGGYHSVDSSEQSFKLAARVAMVEGMPKCDPVLLEPICQVKIAVPNDATAKVHGLISGRRGQILGFHTKEAWDGWDEIEAYMPQAEIHNLIVELRSLTLGVGWYTFAYDHLAELTGRLADQVLAQYGAKAEEG